jgi:hypothetical protein
MATFTKKEHCTLLAVSTTMIIYSAGKLRIKLKRCSVHLDHDENTESEAGDAE